ncbi:MAG: GDSL-type esterase/lipase family protein [bacterium]|nr:GDSL-type esterase/lipase family protein [bacterium]
MILFLGDSLTEGYRLAPGLAFPGRIAEKLAAEGRPRRVINAGVAGHTTGDALRRLPLLLGERKDADKISGGRDQRPDDAITDLVIELGVNDLLQRVPVETVRANLSAIVHAARAAFPEIRIFLFRVPALTLRFEFAADGQDALQSDEPDAYARSFADLFATIAAKENLILLPFLLEGVLLRPDYNQADLIHPNPRGQELVVENVWRSLKDYF